MDSLDGKVFYLFPGLLICIILGSIWYLRMIAKHTQLTAIDVKVTFEEHSVWQFLLTSSCTTAFSPCPSDFYGSLTCSLWLMFPLCPWQPRPPPNESSTSSGRRKRMKNIVPMISSARWPNYFSMAMRWSGRKLPGLYDGDLCGNCGVYRTLQAEWVCAPQDHLLLFLLSLVIKLGITVAESVVVHNDCCGQPHWPALVLTLSSPGLTTLLTRGCSTSLCKHKLPQS